MPKKKTTEWLECNIPAKMSIIPLASTIVFPRMIVNIQVVRSRNLKLIEDARIDEILGLVLQEDASLENPPTDQLSRIGVAARLVNKIVVGPNTVQVILLGIRRFEIQKFSQTDPYLIANVACIDPREVENLDSSMLMAQALTLLENLTQADARVPSEINNLIRNNLKGPGGLADQLATHLKLNLSERKEILTTIDAMTRLKVAIRILERAIKHAHVAQEIEDTTKDSINQTQREYYLREQLKTIKRELGESSENEAETLKLRERLEAANLPERAQQEAKKEIERLEIVSPASAEYGVIRTYLDWILDLPWSKGSTDRLDLRQAQRLLDRDHYGLDKVKARIVEHLAVRKLNPNLKGPILCFYGPPGIGKTSLGRSIAGAMGRQFVRMSVGGMRDEAEIRGHRRTYVGAMPGKILQSLKRAGTHNPLFMIDEIDKIGMDVRGDPASALLEVLDPEQNNSFVDLYLDLPFDLSRVMFITTANRLDTIPPALRDRMEIIEMPGYIEEEKIEIARRHLLPRLISEHGLDNASVHITDDAVKVIIRSYTSEAGLRRLEQQISAILRKLAREVAEGKSHNKVVDADALEKLLGPIEFLSELPLHADEVGIATGLAWTPHGGEILIVEATRMRGKGGVRITGQVGDVMRESAQAAMSYVQSQAEVLGIDPKDFQRFDIHIHIPAGAIPKDGPSAGVTMTLALASLMTGRPIRHDMAMTGEITLRGRVLPVGGVREKILAAHRTGIRRVIVPERNRKDLLDVPARIQKEMKLVWVEEIREVLEAGLVKRPARSSKPAPGSPSRQEETEDERSPARA
ncbi:MAG: endopeptidase La [Acidobacteria bacterium]|nr:endopeptidase La [Acidobacteriota bacterium]